MPPKRRSTILLSLILAVYTAFVGCLVQLQFVHGADYAALAASRRSTTLTVTAARGAIADCHGIRLAEDRVGFSLVLDGSVPPSDELLSTLIALLSATDDAWRTADVGSVRAAMTNAGFNRVTPFVLATDVPRATAAVVEEQRARFAGVSVMTVPIREYPCGSTAAHLIGTVGAITAEEYATLKGQGYRLTDTVGKSGLEAALESTLRGQNGAVTRCFDADGVLLSTEETAAATVGDSVILTLDSRLQAAAQQVLEDTVTALRTQPIGTDGQDVQSGAAVLLDVKNGALLAAASAPGYDLSTYRQNAADLLQDPDKPLFNRALFGTFACGSVIKPAVAVAGLAEGEITAARPLLTCDGVYHHYEEVGFAPKCLGSHGDVALTHALRRSCNVYFFDLGRLLGIDRLNRYLRDFGLGQPTGIELGEARGVLASPETKQGAWVAGDTCQCAIGQLDQRFTPLQLAAYAMTLANNGVRYRVHVVQRIERYDGTVLSQTEPQVLSTVAADSTVFAAVREGMCAVTQAGGTAYAAFADAPYTVAAKTGTAQNGSSRSDHGVFIAYAPAEAPEVALAVVLENGTSAPTVTAARRLLDAYFELF